MDDVSWKALYMNEPIEREGLLYGRDELRRYFELPETEPDELYNLINDKEEITGLAFYNRVKDKEPIAVIDERLLQFY